MQNPVHIRLLSQQLYAPQFSLPEDVVSWFGAMQAQEYRLMRLAVTMRTKNPSMEAFQRAFDNGEIIRLHLLRCTWQLIAPEDHSWMVPLCGPHALRSLKGWMRGFGTEIPESEEESVRELLLSAASGHKSLTREEFAQALKEHDVAMDDRRLSFHILLGELKGYLCSGRLEPRKATYSSVEEKVGPSAVIDRDEALARLAEKYFRSHAPATLEDFVWWSGLNVNDCRKGINLLGDRIHSEKWRDGRTFYLMDCTRTKGFRSGKTLYLPSYDEYLIGYKSRDVVLPEAFRPRAHDNRGIFYPVVAKDGIICDNWQPFK